MKAGFLYAVPNDHTYSGQWMPFSSIPAVPSAKALYPLPASSQYSPAGTSPNW